ncbi:MAG: hypothetical protein WBV61_05180 [Rhodanobacteraceae bacterium]
MNIHASHNHHEHSTNNALLAEHDLGRAIRKTLIGTVAATVFGVAALWSPTVLAAGDNAKDAPEPLHHAVGLIQATRDATARYLSVANAEADGYVQTTGCVSSPSDGAMGVHYARLDRLGDGVSDPAEPEVLVYEPTRYGSQRLVAAEYIILADVWDGNEAHPQNAGVPPQWLGQSANFIGFPNRFQLPALYEIHVWAWKDNPAGSFANFNPRVTCDYYDPAS